MADYEIPAFDSDGELLPAELALIRAVERGESYFPEAAEIGTACIRGELIRALLLGTRLRHHPRSDSGAKPRRVRVTAAGICVGPPAPAAADDPAQARPLLAIVGGLRLGRLAGPGGGFLPPLSLEDCRIDGSIDLAGTHLQSLSLAGCRLTGISAKHAHFAGAVNLARCRPLNDPADEAERRIADRTLVAYAPPKEGYGWIDGGAGAPFDRICACPRCATGQPAEQGACGLSSLEVDFGWAEIGGSLTLERCYLRARRVVGRTHIAPRVRDETAARLTGLRVRDSLWIVRSTVIGCITLASAEIEDDVWVLGGKFLASAERRTFDFQLARVGGLFVFQALKSGREEQAKIGVRAYPPIVVGHISGTGMDAGEVWIGEGFYYGRDPQRRGSYPTINFGKADIRRTFKIGSYYPYEVTDAERPNGPAHIHGEVCLVAANIGKNLEIHGTGYEGIAETLGLSDPFFAAFGAEPAEACYLKVTAQGVKVDRRAYISHGCFREVPTRSDGSGQTEGNNSHPAAIDFFKATLGTGLKIGEDCCCVGAIRLNSCVIGREVLVECRRIEPGESARPPASAEPPLPVLLDISESTIKGHLSIGRREPRAPTAAGCHPSVAVTVLGAVSLESTNIQGSVLLGHLRIDLSNLAPPADPAGMDEPKGVGSPQPPTALNLRDCVCGSDLEVHALRWQLPPIPCPAGCPLRLRPRRFDRIFFWRARSRFRSIAEGAHAVIDLRGLQCGLLIDGFGAEWGLVHRLQLRLAGIKVNEVEPASQEPPHASRADMEAMERTRLRWLSFQNSVQEAGTAFEARLERTSSPIYFYERYHCSIPDDFVPQVYDVFSSAFRRAGEDRAAQNVLLEKKDVQNALHFWQLLKQWKRFWWRPALYIPALVLAAALWFGMGRSGFVPNNSLDRAVAALLVGGGLLAFFAWPYLAALFQISFRFAFRYGLSPNRALAVFVGLILLGWVGVHYARNGGFRAVPDWSKPGAFTQRVALVLDVDYEPDDSANALPPPDPRAAGTHREGRALHAAASPCNLDVSSLLYAADVFIPLLDLDQERRCTVRAANSRDGDDSYFGWRLAKALYEILGWIVTSLGLLTITGVLRRDLER